eukprot:TRINITY_DN6543_c0_g1_i1.p1 TRINITY_DN6543_c0_g1~~TRINITY_DN6543_c0_g1_i1.p1  ORF type:complete len:328 (-),score=93.70 TRINITY_DN6543_c0_g1_i1:37-927(-)
MTAHINDFNVDLDTSPNHRKSKYEKKRLHKIVLNFKDMKITDKEMIKIKEIEKELGRPMIWGYSNSKLETQEEFLNNDVNPPLIREMMKIYRITPEVFEKPWIPNINLKVDFGKEWCYVYRGNEIKVENTYTKPSVAFESEPNKWWTFLMFTPDYPTNWLQDEKSFLHWRISNIPDNKVESGEVVADFLPPIPFEKSGGHRYIFLLLEQPKGKIDFNAQNIDSRTLAGRNKFHIENFISKFGLKKSGISFFRSEWNDKLPKLYSGLKLVDGAEHPVFNISASPTMNIRTKSHQKFF